MSKEIQFRKDAKNLIITIPIGVLKWAGEHHPESPLIIIDENVFAEKVMFELQNNLGSIESGLSGFQELLDNAMLTVAESGDECADLAETDW